MNVLILADARFEEVAMLAGLEPFDVEITYFADSCVFRFVRPPVPVSSGQAFRCDPASMI